jgi:hypothetical protein
MLIPFLSPGTYTLAAPDIRCGEYQCEARIEGSPATLAAGQTQSLTLAYGFASGHLRVTISGAGTGEVVVRGSAGFERTLTASTTLSDLAPGSYTLTAHEVRHNGFTYRAEGGGAEVVAGHTTEAVVNYAPVTGRLRVRTSTDQGGVVGRVLRGTEALHSFGSAGGEWELNPGRYTLQPLAFMRNDFRYEASALGVEVSAGQLAETTLEFAPVTTLLEYTVSGLPQGRLAAASLQGPAGYQQGLSTSRRLANLQPGSYRFQAEAVEAGGFTYLPSPAESTLELAAGQHHRLDVAYLRQEAGVYLEIAGQPAETAPSIRLQGGTSHPLNPGLNSGLATGSFSVEAAPITHGGFTYLPEARPASLALAHGQTSRVEVRYTRQAGTLNLVLEGLTSAPLYLTGPMGMALSTGGGYHLLPGDYVLNADPVDLEGFRYTPSIEGGSISLGVGQTHTATVRYTRSTARLEVRVSGVEGLTPLILSGPTSRTLDGSTTLEFLAPGAYTLTPSTLTRDEATPFGTGRFTYRADPLSLALAAGETARASVVYQRQQGSITVSVSGLPAGAGPALRLVGAGLDHGFAGGVLTPLPTGPYTLTPQAVRAGGYTFQANPQSFTLAHGENQSLMVDYMASTGALRIALGGPEGMPAPSARIWRDGILVATQGSGLLEDLLPGEYRVEPLTVRDGAGFDYAAPEQTVTVLAGQTAEAGAIYIKQSSFVELQVSGAPPIPYSLTLSGPRSYSLAAPGRYELVSGSYTASAANLNHSGFIYRATLSSGNISLAPGQTVSLTLTYTRVAGNFRFSVSGLPVGSRALVSLSGPSSHSTTLPNGTATTPDLLPREYTLSTPDLAAGGFTWRASGNAGRYSLAEGQTVPVSLGYAAITGRVQVNLTGVPLGATPSLRIVQGGVLHSFGSSTSYELAPGSYTLQADPLSSGGFTFAPSGQGGFTVTPGQTTTLNVSYAATTGRLRVVTTGLPFAPHYGVSGPQGLTITQADQTFDNLLPGTYTASPNTRDQDVGGGVVYRYQPGRDLAGSGSLALSNRDGHLGEWTPVAPHTRVGVHACIDNRSSFPAQVGFLESTFTGDTSNHDWQWTASGWQRSLWVMSGQNHCITTVLQTSGRSNLRILPFLNIDGPWNNVGGTAHFTQVRVAPWPVSVQASVVPGQTATLNVHYLGTGSVVLQINRTSNNAPVRVDFNGQTYTSPGRHVVNFLWPGSHHLGMHTTHNHGIAFHPSGPNPVTVHSGQTTQATVTYTPENRAALNLTIFKNYSGSDSRFINDIPQMLTVLQNGAAFHTVGLGSHSIGLFPANTYTLNRSAGFEYEFANSCHWWGCSERLFWRLESVHGFPLVPWAGEVYSAQAVWRGVRCAQEGWAWVCRVQ